MVTAIRHHTLPHQGARLACWSPPGIQLACHMLQPSCPRRLPSFANLLSDSSCAVTTESWQLLLQEPPAQALWCAQCCSLSVVNSVHTSVSRRDTVVAATTCGMQQHLKEPCLAGCFWQQSSATGEHFTSNICCQLAGWHKQLFMVPAVAEQYCCSAVCLICWFVINLTECLVGALCIKS